MDAGVVSEVVVLAGKRTVPKGRLDTHVETAKFYEGVTNCKAVTVPSQSYAEVLLFVINKDHVRGVTVTTEAAVAVEPEFNESAQGAHFGFRASVHGELGATKLVPALIAFGEVDLVTSVAADLEAGFGARDVEEACAADVANADVFHWLWRWRDECVSGLSGGE